MANSISIAPASPKPGDLVTVTVFKEHFCAAAPVYFSLQITINKVTIIESIPYGIVVPGGCFETYSFVSSLAPGRYTLEWLQQVASTQQSSVIATTDLLIEPIAAIPTMHFEGYAVLLLGILCIAFRLRGTSALSCSTSHANSAQRITLPPNPALKRTRTGIALVLKRSCARRLTLR